MGGRYSSGTTECVRAELGICMEGTSLEVEEEPAGCAQNFLHQEDGMRATEAHCLRHRG